MHILQCLLLVTAGLLISLPAVAIERHELEQIVRDRMACIEESFGVSFPDNFMPAVQIGVPDSVLRGRASGPEAMYYFQAQLLVLDSTLVYPPPPPPLPAAIAAWTFKVKRTIPQAIDHELGHAYHAELGRELLGRTWPNIPKGATPLEALGYSILAEGIASTVQNPNPPPEVSQQWWPSRITNRQLMNRWLFYDLHYRGGHWLIAGLVEQYGLETVTRYAIAHPITIENGRLARAVRHWRFWADKALKAQTTPSP